MQDYQEILTSCQNNHEISRELIDEFLLSYADSKDHIAQQFNRQIKKYQHVVRKFEKNWINMLRAQFIAHRIFRKGGLVNKYLNHSAIKDLREEKRNLLAHHAANPWRFSFAKITDNPHPDFYKMEDVFTEKQYLLYSQGTTKIIQESNPVLFFNLIAYNGACYQSYGPIAYYSSFFPDDIFFFGVEANLNQSISDEDDLVRTIENNPIPYMLLLSGATYPLSYAKEDLIIHCISEHHINNFDTKALKDDFKIEYNADVYRLMLKGWESHPHFAHAYYDEKKMRLLLITMTDRSFSVLVHVFKQHGYELYDDPHVRLSPTMKITAENILKKDINLNPYHTLFEKDIPEEQNADLEIINELLALAIPEINSGKTPDIEELAKKTGVDPDVARDVINNVMNTLNKRK